MTGYEIGKSMVKDWKNTLYNSIKKDVDIDRDFVDSVRNIFVKGYGANPTNEVYARNIVEYLANPMISALSLYKIDPDEGLKALAEAREKVFGSVIGNYLSTIPTELREVDRKNADLTDKARIGQTNLERITRELIEESRVAARPAA